MITARSYAFFKLFNVAILALTALVGLWFLTSGMRALNEQVVGESMVSSQVVVTADVSRGNWSRRRSAALPTPRPQPTNGDARNRPAKPGRRQAKATATCRWRPPGEHALLYIWILLFGFVGTQLAWTLRPFFGDPVSHSSCSATSTARSIATS